MIRMARFCRDSSDSACTAVRLQCHTGLAYARIVLWDRWSRLFQRQLAL